MGYCKEAFSNFVANLKFRSENLTFSSNTSYLLGSHVLYSFPPTSPINSTKFCAPEEALLRALLHECYDVLGRFAADSAVVRSVELAGKQHEERAFLFDRF